MQPTYLDHNATTPISGAARAAMEPYLEGQYGNPMTAHVFGAGPRAAVEAARRDVLALLGIEDGAAWRVIFNSGASEGLNHAFQGIALPALENGRAGKRSRIVLGGIEHYAGRKPALWLADRFGFEVVEVAPDSAGVVGAEAFLAELDPETTLMASLHWANNETGTIQPVDEIGVRCRELGIPFLCDAVQAAGKVDLTGAHRCADLLTFSAHKCYGPKGVGALVVRRDVVIEPLVHGAGQEEGARAGTHNVAGIVGFAAAVHAVRAELSEEATRLRRLRDFLWKALQERVVGSSWNGRGAAVLPNTLNVSFDGCPSYQMCEEMDRRGFAISAGAACDAGAVTPSHNLLAMGLSESLARTSVRVSLGHATTEHDVIAAADAFVDAAGVIRQGS